MTHAYQMPLVTDLATKVGPRLWRKTILKAGKIRYEGREVDFDRAKLAAYAANFTSGALDQVPFVLVDAQNRHVDLPERFRGQIRGVELTDDDRLEALIETTDDGAKLIADNPCLGVSVRVIDRLERADGTDFGPTLLHVAGTLDPKITGLGPWRPADMSADRDVQVIDLTTPDITPPADTGVEDPAQEERPAVADQLSDEELARLRDILDRQTAPDKPEDTPELTDAELDAIAAAALDDAGPEHAEPELVAASTDTSQALNLANARLDAQQVELAALRAKDELREYEALAADLARTHGIPPHITELARPLLQGSGRTVELSNGSTADAGAVMRSVLHAVGHIYKAVDLSGPVGSAHEGDVADVTKAERDAFTEKARAAGFGK